MIRRVALLLALALGGAAALWWWWTAPPAESERELTSVPGVVPANADGVVLLARPGRAARWAARHPQALALLAHAAPASRDVAPEVRDLLAALLRAAPDRLAAFWRGRDIAVWAPLPAHEAAALGRAATLTGTPCRVIPRPGGDAALLVASSAALLDPREPLAWPPLQAGRRAALCLAGGRWWRVELGRSRLEASAGAPPELPSPTGPSVVATADLAALGGVLAAGGWPPRGGARLAFDAGGWAFALDEPGLAPEVRRLLALGGDAPASSPPGSRRWRGALGDLWAVPGPPLAIASGPAMLAAVTGAAPAGERGFVRGADLAAACTRLADGLEPLPLLSTRVGPLRRAAVAAASVRSARWRVAREGGRIVLEW